ncbi:MAG TPA: hypothetical protein VGU23_05255 [Acidobacteriaceae bacterium]|nr:hypothetical protein [Acidobacteriaceae bacterium]
MTPQLPSPLPRFDRNLLRAARIVPRCEREEWSRVWHAELWHMRHRSCNRPRAAADLSIGLFCDALWLRGESWRRILHGTAALCVGTLSGLLVVATLVALAINGDWHTLSVALAGQFRRFLVEAPLVVVVNVGITSRICTERSSRTNTSAWLMRQLFLATKMTLTLLLSFMLSADVCQPVHAVFPLSADLLQTLLFTVLALVGLRWVFRDQGQRCKQCLRSLAMPARIGRPSHNLLEWNGTELACTRGHGLLSVPEMETSWCQSSRWVEIPPGWDQPASI